MPSKCIVRLPLCSFRCQTVTAHIIFLDTRLELRSRNKHVAHLFENSHLCCVSTPLESNNYTRIQFCYILNWKSIITYFSFPFAFLCFATSKIILYFLRGRIHHDVENSCITLTHSYCVFLTYPAWTKLIAELFGHQSHLNAQFYQPRLILLCHSQQFFDLESVYALQLECPRYIQQYLLRNLLYSILSRSWNSILFPETSFETKYVFNTSGETR